jgi:hypothetical protein
MKRKVLAAILYGAGAVAVANWLDYAFFAWQVYGFKVPFLLWVASIGCVGLAGACAVSFLSYRCGFFVGLAAVCLLWPYFGMLAWSLPWKSFLWLVRIHDHGPSQVTAVLMLVTLTTYSIARLRPTTKRFATS